MTGECIPLVSAALWQEAQNQLQENKKGAGRNTQRQYLLRGIMRCELCGASYCGRTHDPGLARRTNGAKGVSYGCIRAYQRRGNGYDACPVAYVPGIVEQDVWEDIVSYMPEPDRINDHVNRNKPAPEPDRQPLKAVTDALAAKSAEQDTILTLYRTGRIGADALERQLSAIQKEETALKFEAESLAEKHRAQERAQHAASDAAAAVRQIVADLGAGADLTCLPWETRRHVVESIVREIRVGTIDVPGKKRQPDVKITYELLERTTPGSPEKESFIYDKAPPVES